MSEGIQAMWEALGATDPVQGKIDQEIEYFMTHFFDNARNMVLDKELRLQREREQAYRDHEEKKSGEWSENSLIGFCKSEFRLSEGDASICANGSEKTRAKIAAMDFPKLPKGFWLFGKEGTGKTCTAGAVTVEYMKGLKLKSNVVKFYSWQELYELSVKTKGFKTENDYTGLITEKLEGVRLLIIDDFFRTEKSNIPDQFEFALALVKHVISESICLIVTSNSYPAELEEFERKNTLGNASPVVSRLSRYCEPYPFEGKDGRASW